MEVTPIWLDFYDWHEIMDPGMDPLWEHRPQAVSCGAAGWYLERETIEVDTQYCNYLALQYRLSTTAPASSQLKGAIWHFDLVATEPSMAHAALLIDHQIVWEKAISIPAKTGIFNLDIELENRLPVGTPIMFHLHNHGENVWNLGAFRIEPPLFVQ